MLCPDTRVIGYCAVFKVRGEGASARIAQEPRGLSERPAAAGLSKLNSMRPPRPGAMAPACDLPGPVDISSGRTHLEESAAEQMPRRQRQASAWRSCERPVPLVEGLPRKEVIQPQLPLRLPCYDFTPVASPTFDGSLPYGLGHRLRVLLTPMV